MYEVNISLEGEFTVLDGRDRFGAAAGMDMPPRLLRIPPLDDGCPVIELTVMEGAAALVTYPTE